MPFKKRTLEEIIGKLREAQIVLAQGGPSADAYRLNQSTMVADKSWGDHLWTAFP